MSIDTEAMYSIHKDQFTSKGFQHAALEGCRDANEIVISITAIIKDAVIRTKSIKKTWGV